MSECHKISVVSLSLLGLSNVGCDFCSDVIIVYAISQFGDAIARLTKD